MNYLIAEGVLARIGGERSSLYSFLQSQAPEQSAVERKSKIMNGTNEERDKGGEKIKTAGKITREMVSTVRKEGIVNQGGVKIRCTIPVSFFFLRSGFRLWSSLHSRCRSIVTQKKSNSADFSKSRGKTIDKQRLFLIITIDMLSFRALLSFLSPLLCLSHTGYATEIS